MHRSAIPKIKSARWVQSVIKMLQSAAWAHRYHIDVNVWHMRHKVEDLAARWPWVSSGQFHNKVLDVVVLKVCDGGCHWCLHQVVQLGNLCMFVPVAGVSM